MVKVIANLLNWKTDWLNFTQNGNDISVAVQYRIEPDWDDEEYLTASTRLLSNGVVSIPATHSWGSTTGGTKALENDLEIKSVTFSTDMGELQAMNTICLLGKMLQFQ